MEYVFKHVSMREVPYSTLVTRRRQELHLREARAIAALYPADEHVEIIAYHYGKTEGHAEAVGWLERAGDLAASVYATESALAHYYETIRRLEQREGDPLVVARVEEKLGTSLLSAGRYEEALEILQGSLQTYRDHRDLAAAGRVAARMGMAHRYRQTPEEGIALVQPMIDLLTWSGPSSALAGLYVALATLYFLVGKYQEHRGAAERAGEIAKSIGDQRLLGEAEERRVVALLMLGQPKEARRVLEAALPLVEAEGASSPSGVC